MKAAIIALVIVLALAPSAWAVDSTLHLADGTTVVISASNGIQRIGLTKFVIKGDAHLKSFNKATGVSMSTQADTITATLFAGQAEQKAAGAQNMIESVELVGSPKMTHVGPKIVTDQKTGKAIGQVNVTTDAIADSITYNGAEGIAYLLGHVKITMDDPSLFAEPAVTTGDKASINLRHAVGSGNFDFQIESNPPSVSQIDAVPRAKEGK